MPNSPTATSCTTRSGATPGSGASDQRRLAWTEVVARKSLDEVLVAHKCPQARDSPEGWIWVRSKRNPKMGISEQAAGPRRARGGGEETKSAGAA
ncbi:hypothetical protein OC834_006785 [Tilletia horrida]|nr:hypothetical protein OC834_006785 [Tilletia horrida]